MQMEVDKMQNCKETINFEIYNLYYGLNTGMMELMMLFESINRGALRIICISIIEV